MDDLVVKDPFIVQVLQMAAPSTVKVEGCRFKCSFSS
ncbi:hypothetical protein ACTPEM_24130 [Clostridioides difficile]